MRKNGEDRETVAVRTVGVCGCARLLVRPVVLRWDSCRGCCGSGSLNIDRLVEDVDDSTARCIVFGLSVGQGCRVRQLLGREVDQGALLTAGSCER